MPRPDHRAFAAALKAARKELRLRQWALGERLGVTERTLSRWETGLAAPQTRARNRVLAALAPHVSQQVYAQLAKSLGVRAPEAEPDPIDWVAVRRTVDDAVRLAAEDLDVGAKRFRSAIDTVLAALEAHGLATKDARAMVAPPREPRRG